MWTSILQTKIPANQPSFSWADGSISFAVPAWYYDGISTATAVDSDLVASNIASGVTILWVLWTAPWPSLPISGIYPWYQLTRNIFYNGSTTTPRQTPDLTAMYDTWPTIVYMYRLRNDSSDDWTVVYPIILTKATLWLTYWASQTIQWTTAWWSPLGACWGTFSDDWSNIIRCIFGSANPSDWQVDYNITLNSWSGYTYTRLSADKIPLANTTPANAIFTYSSVDYLMTMFYQFNSGTNVLDPYLEIH